MSDAGDSIRAIFNAAVDAHMGDPQGKWSTNTKTEGLLTALAEVSGIPHHLARLAVMETAIDKWLVCIEETARSYCRHNIAAATLYDVVKANGKVERTEARSVAKLGGLVAKYCLKWYGESPLDKCRDRAERRVAFYQWLSVELGRHPEVLSFYPPHDADQYRREMADVLSAAKALSQS
jgi:hypothetical protein